MFLIRIIHETKYKVKGQDLNKQTRVVFTITTRTTREEDEGYGVEDGDDGCSQPRIHNKTLETPIKSLTQTPTTNKQTLHDFKLTQKYIPCLYLNPRGPRITQKYERNVMVMMIRI